MNRKEITAFLVDCDLDEFMVYRDEAEKGTVAVGPDGKKYRFSNEQLGQAQILMKEKIMQMTLAEAAAPGAASGTRKEPASPAPKRPAKAGTRKPAAAAGAASKPRKKAAPKKKPAAAKPKIKGNEK